MAVAVVVEFPGAAAEQYDEVIAKLGLTPGGAAMPGQLSHWDSVTDQGTRIADVWASRETFEVCRRKWCRVPEVGVPGPPNIAYYEVYNYFTEGPEAS